MRLAGAILPLVLLGCAVGPNFQRPSAPPVARYTADATAKETLPAEGQAQRFHEGKNVAAAWWRLFRSPKLDALVAEAIANNANLAAAQASLRRSQANLQAGYGVFFPQLDANADAFRQRFTPQRFGVGTPSSVFNLFTLGTTISYVLDVFGGQRRTVEGLKAQMEAERYTWIGVYVMLTGNVVTTAIARAAYGAEIEATERFIAVVDEQLRLTRAQAEAGTVPYSNVLAIEAQLASAEATLPPLRQKQSQAEHLLATLVGRVPAEWKAPNIAFADFALPVDLPLTAPSELVHRRPDIRVAEAQLHQSSAAIGVATAALFPSITLSGSFGVNSVDISNLFLAQSIFWSFGGGLLSPLFHGGTLWYQRKAAIAAFDQSFASYRQVVLGAFAQVADALRALEYDAAALQAQARSLGAAEEGLRLITVNYKTGVANYVQVLIANAQYHQAKIAYIAAQAQRLQDTAALLVALGGGWWNDRDRFGNE